MNYEKYYDLETFIFNEVKEAFHRNRKLTAEQFFCIIIWKAERVKSIIAKKIIERIEIDGVSGLEDKIGVITSEIYKADSYKGKLKVLLVEYEFRLPTASAILSVLYPDHFSVYDVRVCEILKGDFHKIADRTFEKLWIGYVSYLEKVRNVSLKATYREADKYLWGKSLYDQLISDLKNDFKKRHHAALPRL